MAEVQRRYVPAAGRDWCLPLYDPLVKVLGGDSARRVLVEQAGLRPAQRILEIGCGTGSLLMSIKREYPDVEAVGLDPDPKALARAKRKVDSASVSIRLDRGFSDALPYLDASFDRVFSCFMFHHLTDKDQKRRTLREVRRVLRPGGRFHMLDFAPQEPRRGGLLMHRFHSSDQLRDNAEDRVLARMREAGFTDPKRLRQRTMLLVLRINYYQALAPMGLRS